MSRSSEPPPPMLAHGASVASSGSEPQAARGEPLLTADADPEAAVDKVLEVLGRGEYLQARSLAAEALARFPDHERARWAWMIFENRGRARISKEGLEPPRDKEYEWLRNPPEWARGKWVALVGADVVAAAESLADVTAALRSKTFSTRPLVHRID